MNCKRYWISGRVQGVCFRASAQARAGELELTGWVRNMADGRVEVLACGKPDALVEFEAWLAVGPLYADVSEVLCAADTEDENLLEFVVR